jgi:hypothetical protein
MRAQIDITFEFTGKSMRSRAAGRAVVPCERHYIHFSTDHRIAHGLSNVPATVILFIHLAWGIEWDGYPDT